MWRLLRITMMATLIIAATVACLGQSKSTMTESTGTTLYDTTTPAATTESQNEGQGTVAKQWANPPAMQLESGKDYQAILHTSKGDMTVDLLETEAPKTVNNFVFLATQGYYTNVPFHRIIKGFMVQTGDPTGTGRGGPGYRFNDEPVTRDYVRGTVAMANAGPNTNGSQFFIMHADYGLPKNYTIFGQVTEGFETLDAIASTPVHADSSGRGEMSVPNEPVTLESVEIITK